MINKNVFDLFGFGDSGDDGVSITDEPNEPEKESDQESEPGYIIDLDGLI